MVNGEWGERSPELAAAGAFAVFYQVLLGYYW
jgi:hypothetical protein